MFVKRSPEECKEIFKRLKLLLRMTNADIAAVVGKAVRTIDGYNGQDLKKYPDADVLTKMHNALKEQQAKDAAALETLTF